MPQGTYEGHVRKLLDAIGDESTAEAVLRVISTAQKIMFHGEEVARRELEEIRDKRAARWPR